MKKSKKEKSRSNGLVFWCQTMSKVLSRMDSVVGTDTGTLSVRMKDSICRISAQSRDMAIAMDAPAEGEGEFSIYASTLAGLMQGRYRLSADLHPRKPRMSFRDDSTPEARDGAYSGSISILPFVKINVDSPAKNVQSIPWSSGVIQHFDLARKYMALREIVSVADGSQHLSVRVKDGRMTCGSFDSAHAGIYSVDVDFPADMSFSHTFRRIEARDVPDRHVA